MTITKALVVDLDGSLIYTDTLHESALKLAGSKPFNALLIPFWLSQGKAVLKNKLSQKVNIELETLPYNLDSLLWLKEKKEAGRHLVLCIGTDISVAHKDFGYGGSF